MFASRFSISYFNETACSASWRLIMVYHWFMSPAAFSYAVFVSTHFSSFLMFKNNICLYFLFLHDSILQKTIVIGNYFIIIKFAVFYKRSAPGFKLILETFCCYKAFLELTWAGEVVSFDFSVDRADLFFSVPGFDRIFDFLFDFFLKPEPLRKVTGVFQGAGKGVPLESLFFQRLSESRKRLYPIFSKAVFHDMIDPMQIPFIVFFAHEQSTPFISKAQASDFSRVRLGCSRFPQYLVGKPHDRIA